MKDRRKENKPRGTVPWDEPYERRGDRLGKLRDWRATLSVDEANENYCYANTSKELLLENIDWLIAELINERAKKNKILRSLGAI